MVLDIDEWEYIVFLHIVRDGYTPASASPSPAPPETIVYHSTSHHSNNDGVAFNVYIGVYWINHNC